MVVIGALVPAARWLLIMGCGDQVVSAFVAELTGLLAPIVPVLAFLDGDAGTAAARDRPRWLEWLTGKLARYQLVPHARAPGRGCR